MEKTTTFNLGNTHYCSYCGCEAKEHWTWSNHRPDKLIHFCGCENAKKELEIRNKIADVESEASEQVNWLKKKMPEFNETIINKMKYEHHLKRLKREFNVK